MKHLITICAVLLITASALLPQQTSAQAPNKMSYQAVIRNSSNALITNTAVGMQISILQGSINGTAVYVETQIPTTNANGLVSLEIGSGTLVTGTFGAINWANGPYFIKTQTDPTGGNNYTIFGTNELMSVPYALFSANGTPGATGPQGPIGLTGATGAPGPQGATGSQGPIGLTGATGATGTNGVDGAVGATGPQGPIGLTGATGATGPQGATGSQGPIGLTGATGATGTNGVDGAVGATGPQGPIGLTGATGATGPQGPIGLTGSAGTGLPTGVNTGNVVMYDAIGNNWVAKNITIGATGGSEPFSIMPPYLALNFCIIYQGIYPSNGGSGSGDNYIANIQMFAGTFAPGGTYLCNGTLLSIAQNTALFSLIGTIYGGNGSTTFALPDLRGRFPIHTGSGPGLSSYSMGQMGGSENKTLFINNIPAHNHSVLFTTP
jgi:microcystin-dependent protein